MAKQLKDWLDEFVNNGADPNDVIDWPENAGGGAGEPIEVEELPEVGEEGKIYKTPDGTLWTYEVSTQTVCDLTVGNSYKMVETISYDYVVDSLIGSGDPGIIGYSTSFIEDQDYPSFQVIDSETYDFAYCPVDDNNYVYYNLNYDTPNPPETINLQYKGNIAENPDIEITQFFVDTIENGSGSYTLDDLIPLFQNSSHEEEIGTWKEIKGLGASPFVIVKAGAKIVIDFSVGSYGFSKYNEFDYIGDNSIYTSDNGGTYGVMLRLNSIRTQIVASFIDNWEYQSVSNEVVIYNGAPISDQYRQTSDIDYAWPTVEFTIDDDYQGTLVFEPYDDLSITN